MHPVHPQRGQHLQPVAQRGNAHGLGAGIAAALSGQRVKVLARMGLEGEHRCRQAGLARVGHQRAHQGLVAQMHAVEVADGQRTGLVQMGRGQGSENFHRPDYKDNARDVRAESARMRATRYPEGHDRWLLGVTEA